MFLRSFRFRLALLFGLLALGALAALAYPIGRMLGDELLRERGDALRGIAHSSALLLAEGLQERTREVQLLAESKEVRRIGLDRGEWTDEIRRLQAGRPRFAWVGVADRAGTVRAASGGLLVGQSVAQRPWFQSGTEQPYAGDVHTAKLLAALLPAPPDEPLRFIDIAAPLRDAAGRTLGVLGVHVDWRLAQDMIDKVRSDDRRDAGMQVFIVNRDGQTIHSPVGPAAAPGLERGSAPALRTWTDGESYLTASATLPTDGGFGALGWTVVVRQPAAQALLGVQQARWTVAVAGAAAALGAMLLAWVAAGRFAAPLEEISDVAERIGDGDHSARIPLSRRASELERLSLSLSRMTQRLVAREHALQQANDALESRVAERTADLARANVELERLAHRDALSGLHNRRAADTLLAQALVFHRRHRRPLGVLLCDIDHFKRVNDSHGHAAGDRVIQAVARGLGALLRESDSAARFGGEEFLVILPETDSAGVARVGEKLRAAIAALPLPGVGPVTMSLGGAVAEAGQGGADALLRRADEALYAAKRDGRDRVVVAAAASADAAAPAQTVVA